MAAEFDDRVSRLLEHIIEGKVPTADEYLDRAEQALARGRQSEATFYFNMASIQRSLDNINEALDDEDEDDAC